MTETKPIHTLNARDNVMLEVIRNYFKLTPHHMHRQIQGMRATLEDILSKKGISYSNLRSALVPDRKRREIALVFDTTAIESSWYGLDVFERIIPQLDKRSNHSILVGDYLDRPGEIEKLFSAFEESVRLRRNVEFRHPSQFYIVYLNNLTDAMVRRFDEGLAGYEAYVGFADTTYASAFKLYLSTMLVNLGIKHGHIFIQGHEPDRPDADDLNMCGYPFEETGFTCRSVSSDLEGVLLSFKIERPVFSGFEVDTELALNAISLLPLPLDDFVVEVEAARLNYVKTIKKNSVERAGLEAITSNELGELIKAKISGSYIYNLVVLEEYDIAKFNIIIELPSRSSEEPTRLLAALEYKPEQKILRLLTLY
ncbi:hypothetical protein G9409_06470 [Chlorobium sp. BLA1]|uniref:hypothetical protein n=1 Tax=Candidatus Chlorobium masyuteum TaxID=2716876 RepID=UPI001420C806|nr:hypothetical protein [Candidatus Chlorobium masyuteum]NHQ60239.1 hypothetical protein [Candidatus Chlorobium masyuteum]